jgi:putative PIN family toxin of toxin-antitoxin system
MLSCVLDTCILVSALRSRKGASNTLLRCVGEGAVTPIVSISVFLEYEAVLKRAEHRLATGMSLEAIDLFLAALASSCKGTEPNFRWRPQLADPGDEMILEAALNGGATAIVTHNFKDFGAATTQFGIAVLTPQEALKRIRT